MSGIKIPSISSTNLTLSILPKLRSNFTFRSAPFEKLIFPIFSCGRIIDCEKERKKTKLSISTNKDRSRIKIKKEMNKSGEGKKSF